MSTLATSSGRAGESIHAAKRSSRGLIIDVTWFFGLSLGLALAASIAGVPPELMPFLLVLGPAALALVLAWREGDGALRRLGRMLTHRPPSARWYWVIGLPVAWSLGTVAIAVALGSPTAGLFDKVLPSILIIPLVVLIPAFVEELAWRGYALPRLMTAMSPFKATLLLALPWTLIHLPLFVSGQMNAQLLLWPLPVSIAAYSVILGWIFVKSGGSVLLTGLVHAGLNGVSPLMTGVEPNTQWVIRNLLAASIAVVIVVFDGFRQTNHAADRILGRAIASEA